MRTFIIFLLYVGSFSLFAQQNRLIHIDMMDTTPLSLSQIADQIDVIPLDKEISAVMDVFVSDEYLFIATHTSIIQLDLSGKIIKQVAFNGFVSNIGGDVIKKELYISVGNEIKVYDYSLKYLRSYKTKNDILNCFYNNNTLWIQSVEGQHPESHFKLSYIDMSTGIETFLPFTTTTMVTNGGFSLYDGKVYSSYSVDSVLYEVNKQKVTPFMTWSINPPAKTEYEKGDISKKGFIGKYLFVNYNRNDPSDRFGFNDQSFLYLKDMQSNKYYNVKYKYKDGENTEGLADDVYNTGFVWIDKQINIRNAFFFVRDSKTIKSKTLNGKPIGNGPVLFIVKTK